MGAIRRAGLRQVTMQRTNLDLGIPLTRLQWAQLGESANFRTDDGVMQWSPSEFDVIRVSIIAADTPEGWSDIAPPSRVRNDEHEVAHFVYNDGRPFARVEPPAQPQPPAVTDVEEHEMQVALERWVREKWHELLRESGLAYEPGALPPNEPESVD